MPDLDRWNAEDGAIWQEKFGTGPAARAITLRHPTYPFTASWDPKTGERLIEIAESYLGKVKHLLGLPNTPSSGALQLTWLPISGDGTNPRALTNSVWITRRNPDQPSQIIDHTAILFYVQALSVGSGELKPIGSRLGIRIIAHVSTGAQPTVRITGATRSIGLFDQVPMGMTFPQPGVMFSPSDFFNDVVRNNLRALVKAAAGLGDVKLAIAGLSIRSAADEKYIAEVYMTARRRSDRADTPSEALTLRIPSDQGPAVVEKFPLFSHCADVTAKLFDQDPASEDGSFAPHPHCGPDVFEPYRSDVALPGLTPGNPTKLTDDRQQVEVKQSKLCGRLTTGAGPPNETQSEEAKLDIIPHARTNIFAAVSSYQHARNLFDTMRSYGLLPEHYFRRAAMPLHVRYRAGVPPGPGKDGNTVNARVDYDPADPDFDAALDDDDLKPLQIRYALGDVQRSGSRREPLGVAADPRWNWHEFGHVLIAASTGALELTFVHSTGDALAAILSDPASNLSDSTKSKVAPSWRGATFPWVYLNRRHDRSVYGGWSWSGSFHRPARFSTRSAFLRKGYDSEQILSTTLFRLYRSLGGDTFAEPSVRQSAADYTAYLIMRAIAWLGPINWVPAETPDQFVSALIDADIATAPTTPAFPERVGGCAHKVVRWAFEAQGLYAASSPQDVINAPGHPPEVDIFIDDRRAAYKPAYAADPAHAAGSYVPVPLDWKPLPPESPDGSAWHATEQAIRVDDAGDVWVTVRNRGSMGAAGVIVDIWHAAPTGYGRAPDWKSGEWTHLGTTQPKAVGQGASETFGPMSGLPAGRPRCILAAATCPADPANIDPSTGLPCAAGPTSTPIVDLVAGDNNLGLRLLPGA